ncbi:hypothetical protein [Nostoc sp.]|uniref:hypothetical protein n=1 Tax=Nostoc sp. TaxID=1180 RepID=UPI002FFCC15C
MDFGLKISTKYLLTESQRILFIPIWYDTKLPKLVLFGVKETARLSSEQIILSRATWCHLGELRYITEQGKSKKLKGTHKEKEKWFESN